MNPEVYWAHSRAIFFSSPHFISEPNANGSREVVWPSKISTHSCSTRLSHKKYDPP